MTAIVDMVGATFGRLTVVSRAENDRHGKANWRCRCSCGTETIVYGGSLRKGRTQSCGCWHREDLSARCETHGESRAPEYMTWLAMRQRCYSPKHRAWRYYGARGISICDRWRNDYEAFLEDMGRRPSLGHSIDRIDVNGNYEPSNCRWATRSEQERNKRKRRPADPAQGEYRAGEGPAERSRQSVSLSRGDRR